MSAYLCKKQLKYDKQETDEISYIQEMNEMGWKYEGLENVEGMGKNSLSKIFSIVLT